MGKMKETAPKGKKNPSAAMTVPGDDDRAARELAIANLAMMGEAGYEKIAEQAEGKLHELEIVEKDQLENVAFYVIDAKFNESTDYVDADTGEHSDYMFITVYCSDGKVRAFSDGGSGIRGQIGALTRAKDGTLPEGGINPLDPTTAIHCPGGLKPSKPYKNKINGAMTVTWRLSTIEREDKTVGRGASAGNNRASARA